MVQPNENAGEQNYTTRDSNTSQNNPSGPPLGADQLAYMADMIGELDKLAREGGMETLSGLLALAQVEARRSRQALSSTI
jgi:hypothetical protein